MDNKNSDRPDRRTAFVARELQRFKLDIVALSETRRAEEGQLREELGGYTFFWKGKDDNEPRIHGVGFAIRNEIVDKLTELPVGVNERLMTLRIQLDKNQHATIISAYAPTLDSDDEVKEIFYSELDQLISSTPNEDKLILLGDFNARVGQEHIVWGDVIGKNGMGKANSNGIMLMTKCAEHNLVITNTIFRQQNKNKASWQHPRSKHWHLIDYIIVRKRDQGEVLITKAITGADECWTDHRLISSVMKLKLKPKIRSQKKQQLNKKYNVESLKDPSTANKLEQKLLGKLPVQVDPDIVQHWEQFKSAVKEVCDEVVGHKKKKHQDWFDENDEELQHLVDQKRQAYQQLHNNPNSTTVQAKYRDLKRTVQCRIREIKNDWWRAKAEELQNLSDINNSRAFFRATKEIYGPTSKGQVPLKSKDGKTTIKSEREINDRWREHFEGLLNQETTYDKDIINIIPQHPVDDTMSRIPTLEDAKTSINRMKSNKAAGPDGIPADIYKHGGNLIQNQLHMLIVKIWVSEQIPSELRNADIVKIYKNKGDRGECGNYRGISLLSTAGKVLSGILNDRLKTLAEQILPETQAGFRPNRGTADMIFTVRQLQEKCREQNKPLYMAFIDLTKAFDTVDRELLWEVLARYGCPPKFIRIIRLLHDQMMATVLISGGDSEPFEVKTGVKQGCIKAPTLFSIFIAVVILITKPRIPTQIHINYRLDGKVLNLTRLKSKTKISNTALVEFQYADDNDIAAQSETDLQTILDAFSYAYSKLGLKINATKTQVIFQPAPKDNIKTPPAIKIGEVTLKNVDSFPYLGSLISTNADIDAEVKHRIQQAAAAFGKLRKRVFQDSDIRLETKIKVYKAIIITTLMYASETWTTYRKHIKLLEKFNQRCLRNIIGIKWEDKRTNLSVLDQAEVTSIETLIVKNQLRWTGHVIRMGDERLPKQIFYSELSEGKRDVGGPKKRFKDNLKTNLKKCEINVTTWEEVAKDRPRWRDTIRTGVAVFEEHRREDIEEKRRRRKERVNQPRIDLPPGLDCPACNRPFRARIGLYSHYRALHQNHQLH